MTGRDCLLKLLAGETPERIPNMPITMMFAADTLGVSYREYVTDYRKLADAQMTTAEKYRLDYVSVISDPGREASGYGAMVRFFDDQPPAIDEVNALLAEKSAFQTLKPLDLFREGSRTLDRIQAAELLAKNAGQTHFIEGWVEGPCAESADVRGINRLMLDFMDDPNFVRELFDFTTENAIRFAKTQIDAGADLIGVGDAAGSLVGPKIYEQFVLPFEQKLIAAIHETKAKVRLHICGNTTRITALMAKSGADLIDLDSMVDMKKARDAMGERQILTGNLDPVKIVCHGDPKQITEKLAECRAAAGKNYILAAGCEIPRGTPDENLLAFAEFARSEQV
ncbi:MAG: uroporphyrinogen decarboxylase family protein [Planctomycetaceae bacterium]|nr:uroporphyrinogen decarboxylase family protein [Planctomycetaceae bacterium]